MLKLKKLLAVMTALALAVSMLGMVTVADEVTVVDSGTFDNDVTWSITSDGELIITGSGEIPDSAWDSYLYVPWLGNQFDTVIICDGITSIGDYAFDGRPLGWSEGFKSITIADSVTSIGDRAFSGCTNLSSVYLSSNLTSIGDYAFYECESLVTITIPESVTSIGKEAFGSCYSLSTVTIPASVTSIGDLAFDACSALTTVYVDDANQYYSDIDGVLFNKDQSELIYYPTVHGLSTYTIPESVTSVADYAFCNTNTLRELTLSSNLVTIGKGAFRGCSSIESITIPASVTSIDELAFPNSGSSLSSISVDSNNQYYSAIDGILFNKDQTELVCYPAAHESDTYEVPEGVISIGNYAFYYCTNLTSVTLPSSLISIGTGAFEYCSKLTSVDVSYGLESIGSGAFSETRLASIDLPNSVTSIGSGAFSETNLSTIVLPNSITSIQGGTFVYAGLDTIVIQKSVTYIGATVFWGNDLTDVYYTGTEEEWNAIEIDWSGSGMDNTPLKNATIHYNYVVEYEITIAETTNGTVTSDVETAAAGETVTLTVTPDEGYEISSVTVTDEAGNEVTVADDYTFTMPENDVTVTAVFAEVVEDTSIWTETRDEWVDNGNYASIAFTLSDYCDNADAIVSGDNVTITVTVESDGTYFNGTIGVNTPDETAESGSSWASAGTLESTTSPDTWTFTVDVASDYAQVQLWWMNSDCTYVSVTDISVTVNATEDEPDEPTEPTTYAVTLGTTENGTVTADVETAEAGATVTLTVTPADGYVVSSVTVTDAEGNEVAVADDYTFTMPESDVTVSAVFEAEVVEPDEPTEPDEPAEPTTYTVTVGTTENGTVTADVETAEAGATVTLTVTPDDGYVVSSVTVTDANGNEVAVADDYTFTMPESDVTVSAVFEAEATEPDEPTDPDESEDETYTITVTVTVTGGTATTDKDEATEGETVTITITPADGYTVTGVTVVDSYGNTITVTVSGGKYSFVMPSSEVTITPIFEETSAEHTHTYVFSGWVWASDFNSAYGVFYCSECGTGLTVNATITSTYSYGVLTRTAAIYYDGTWYTDSKLDVTSISTGTTTIITTPTTDTTETTTETIEISEPIEPTDTEIEDDGETTTVATAEAETNPTTGIAISLLPMAIAALAAVSSKRR